MNADATTVTSSKARPLRLPVCVLAPGADMAAELNLPSNSTNLFQRLIRNPRAESDRAKERECAEMLCGLLQNAPEVRRHLFVWMARLVGIDPERLRGLRYAIDTEQAIGSKRDDLRVSGTTEGAGSDSRVLIWTIEVKVGASFHQSGAQFGKEETENDEDQLPVNQLLNYDHWLAQQQAVDRAGFVLALYDRTEDLPPQLTCSWACISWTRLGEQLADALRACKLDAGEQLLARHVLGFVRGNLWRTSEMSDTRLDYNDISLIRAFATLAKDCEAKVNSIVEPLREVLEKSGIGRGKVSHTESLFKGGICSYVERELAPQSCIYAGIGGDEDTGEDYLAVAIETPRSHPGKPAFRAFLRDSGDKLRKLKWELLSQESETEWIDLWLSTPLAALLLAEDQEKAVRDFVAGALNDLKELGVVDAFNRTIGDDTGGKGKQSTQ